MKTNRPYVQLDPAVIEQARQMDSVNSFSQNQNLAV